ncbi:MAG: hypothetical protein JW892_09905 [Anaerolineae bacterium]|nr:hypothetical protein [Anaerolineae bacterium]
MVSYHLYRDAFSEVYTYRYRLTDVTGALELTVSWPGLPAADRPEEISFTDAQGQQLALLRWEDRSWWYGDRFWLFDMPAAAALATIEEQWRIVDRLLLRLPGYKLTLNAGETFIARGSRYSQQLYELFALSTGEGNSPEEMRVGEVSHPTSGPTYILQVEHPYLESHPVLLATLGVILDLWGVQREQRA